MAFGPEFASFGTRPSSPSWVGPLHPGPSEQPHPLLLEPLYDEKEPVYAVRASVRVERTAGFGESAAVAATSFLRSARIVAAVAILSLSELLLRSVQSLIRIRACAGVARVADVSLPPRLQPPFSSLHSLVFTVTMGKKSNQARFPLVRPHRWSLPPTPTSAPDSTPDEVSDLSLWNAGTHQKDDPAGRRRRQSRTGYAHRRLSVVPASCLLLLFPNTDSPSGPPPRAAKALEMFLASLVTSCVKDAEARGSSKLTPYGL